MAKRGERRPYRMEYEWHLSNGDKLRGVETFTTRERADDAAASQRRRKGPNGESCTAVVRHRPR